MNESNLRREGRQPLFTREKALELLEARALFDVATPVSDFVDMMVASDVIPRKCCDASMRRLLSGKMFPDLKDAEGKPFNYAAVRKAPRGHPQSAERIDYETGAPKKPMPRLRREMLDSVLRSAREIVVSELQKGAAVDRQNLQERMRELELKVDQIVRSMGPKCGIALPEDTAVAPVKPPEVEGCPFIMPQATGQFDHLLPMRPSAAGFHKV